MDFINDRSIHSNCSFRFVLIFKIVLFSRCFQVNAALDEFDLMLQRVDDYVAHRINAVLDDIANVLLYEFPDDEPIKPVEFARQTQHRCQIAAKEIQSKSNQIENAVHDIIDLLCGDSLIDTNNDDEDDFLRPFSTDLIEDDEELENESTLKQTIRTSIDRKKSATTLTVSSRRKREIKKETLQNAIKEFIQHFSERTLDAIVGLIKSSLEKLRRRFTLITASDFDEKPRSFQVFAELIIPIVTIRPSTNEIQMFINKSVQSIISVSKFLYQWNQEGQRIMSRIQNDPNHFETSIEIPSSDNDSSVVAVQHANLNESEENPTNNVAESIPTVGDQTTIDVLSHRSRGNTMLTVQEFVPPVKPQFTSGENFFKLISENKDINKLVGQLSTCISVIKRVKTFELRESRSTRKNATHEDLVKKSELFMMRFGNFS